MALILNIETATETCSVCLSEGGLVLALKESTEAYSHAGQITLLIEACMQEAGKGLSQLDAVALSSGPGSYTALRVGTSVAKGICYALDKPLIVVDTLLALALASAQGSTKADLYIPMIDARRMEVYMAIYAENGDPIAPASAQIIDAASFQEMIAEGKSLCFSGNGAPKCQEVLDGAGFHFVDLLCSSSHLVSLAEVAFAVQDFKDIAYYSPSYLKAPNITVAKDIWRK